MRGGVERGDWLPAFRIVHSIRVRSSHLPATSTQQSLVQLSTDAQLYPAVISSCIKRAWRGSGWVASCMKKEGGARGDEWSMRKSVSTLVGNTIVT